jgi:poly(3-hydroxybutyrate) depolymerase
VPVVIAHGGSDRIVPTAGGPVLGGALHAEPLGATVDRWRRDDRTVSFRITPKTGHVWPALATEEIVATFAG